ncbi:MAG TPA: hypothetical protein VKB47_13850 [Terracidiphilus sp.]|nr:hypothetical protein [Terracidiphilus sp.]
MRLRGLVLVILLAASTDSLDAAQRATVDQLEQKLASPPSPASSLTGVPVARLQDATLAFQIDELQLSERLTPATLQRILKAHTFGPQTQTALQSLADRSSLLDPPASELPNQPAPDADQQQHILEMARAYVFRTLTRLPNFFATRATAQFYGIPPEQNQTGLPMYVGLHPRGSYSREITYRNGKEVIDPMEFNRSPAKSPESYQQRWSHSGLETWGEFGPEPAVILIDSGNGSIAFHNWEQTPQGVAAVFRFSVPEESSHYEVNYSCNYSNSFHAQPAYHGSLAIDPTSGAILRIVLQADSKPDDPISHVSSVIEYGPVEVGGRSYICPLRSLAFSVEESNACSVDARYAHLVHAMVLNRTTFTDYHRLGSTSKIILDTPETHQELPK